MNFDHGDDIYFTIAGKIFRRYKLGSMVNNKEHIVVSTVLQIERDTRFPVYFKPNQKNKWHYSPWFFFLLIFDIGKIIPSDLEAEILKTDMLLFSFSFLMLMWSWVQQCSLKSGSINSHEVVIDTDCKWQKQDIYLLPGSYKITENSIFEENENWLLFFVKFWSVFFSQFSPNRGKIEMFHLDTFLNETCWICVGSQINYF